MKKIIRLLGGRIVRQTTRRNIYSGRLDSLNAPSYEVFVYWETMFFRITIFRYALVKVGVFEIGILDCSTPKSYQYINTSKMRGSVSCKHVFAKSLSEYQSRIEKLMKSDPNNPFLSDYLLKPTPSFFVT